MAGLPGRYAKMGFKRGWKAYNLTKRKVRKSKSKTKVVYKMARRRKGGFRKYYRRAKSAMTFGNVTKVLVGAALAAVYEIFVSPMIPLDGLIKNILELGAGLYLAAGRFPMPVKAFGAALATVNAYSLVMAYMPGSSRNTSTGSDW